MAEHDAACASVQFIEGADVYFPCDCQERMAQAQQERRQAEAVELLGRYLC